MMGWTKRETIGQAFSEIGIQGYEFSLSPEELNDALIRMDAMMAAWNRQGIRIGYALPSTQGGSDINAQSGISDDAFEAVYTNLAIRLAPTFGKTPSRETKQVAKAGFDTLMNRMSAMPPQTQLPGTMPGGAGNRWRNNNLRPFLAPPVEPLLTGPDGEMEFK